MSHELIREVFVEAFSNAVLNLQTDSAVLDLEGQHLAFTTDSFVVDPIFFPGGDIGKLAVCGTVNDLAVCGAAPSSISAAFIIEEGLPVVILRRVVRSMAEEAGKAGVSIVTGDTKVVNRGKCDRLFINTSGVGTVQPRHLEISTGRGIRPGDKILLNGTVGDHGMAVMAARNELNLRASILSDCASLNGLIQQVLTFGNGVRFMRDPTRGGLATVMAELADHKDFGIHLFEENIRVKPTVKSLCEVLGFDPLYVANEGKVVIVADSAHADHILQIMRSHELGREAEIIGEVTSDHAGKAWLETSIGGKRILSMLAGEQLPRIC